jgi:nicotinamidase-related amidase
MMDGTTALLVVDMQKTVVSEGQGFGLAMEKLQPGSGRARQKRIEEVVIPTIQTLLAYFRKHGAPIVYLMVGSDYEDYRDLPGPFRQSHQSLERQSGVPHTLWSGSPSYAIREEVAPVPGELVVKKRSFGAFNTSDLDERLHERGITSLVITGVGTAACVESTARDAADRGYWCVLVDEGMASYDEGAHAATLRAFHVNFGRVARSAQDVIEAIESRTAI